MSDVEICMENRYGKTNHHKMEAYTKMKNHEIVRKIFVDIDVLKQQKYSDNYNDIVSCFEHENRHLFQHMNKHKVMPGEEEYDALRFQVNTSTFRSCSSGFQKEIRLLLNKETPNYIKRICPDLY